MSDNITPYEIQVEILKKLPVKSVLKFRLVSKQYKSLIDSPGFISDYGVRESHPHRLLVSYKDYVTKHLQNVCFVDNDDDTLTQQEFPPTVPYALTKLFSFLRVIGSSRGLLCLYGYGYDFDSHIKKDNMIIIWNPSIRKSIVITSPGELGWPSIEFGFGVCPLTSDIVVVKSVYENRRWEVEIFTMSSGIWKRVPSTNLPLKSIDLVWHQVVIDRFIYWGAVDRDIALPRAPSRVVSFDLTTKEFGIVDLPDNLKQPSSGFLTVSKLKESLVVSEVNEYIQDSRIDIWIQMERGVAQSFKKLFTISTPVYFLGFKNNGDSIIVTERHGDEQPTLQIYERCSQHVSGLGIYGEEGSFMMGSYMETMLLSDRPDCFMY